MPYYDPPRLPLWPFVQTSFAKSSHRGLLFAPSQTIQWHSTAVCGGRRPSPSRQTHCRHGLCMPDRRSAGMRGAHFLRISESQSAARRFGATRIPRPHVAPSGWQWLLHVAFFMSLLNEPPPPPSPPTSRVSGAGCASARQLSAPRHRAQWPGMPSPVRSGTSGTNGEALKDY